MNLDDPPGNGARGSLRVGRVAAPLREQVLEVLRQAILDFRLKPARSGLSGLVAIDTDDANVLESVGS